MSTDYEDWLVQYEAEKAIKDAKQAEIYKLLESKGVRINVGACGCCSSPWVSIEIDGVLVVDEESPYDMDMIPEAKP